MNAPSDVLLSQADLFGQLTLDALPLAVCILDPAGKVLAANDLFRDMAERSPLSRREIFGADCFEALRRLSRANVPFTAFIDGVRQVLDGRLDNIAREYECHGYGRPCRFRGRAVRLPGDPLGRVLVSHVEVTARREAQQRLQDLNVRLEDTIAQRTGQLRQSVDDLELFTQVAAHDLRNPLCTIQGFAQMLLSSHASELSSGARDCALSIARSADQLSAMLEGLRELSQVARAMPARETVDVTAMARDIAEELARCHGHRTVTAAIADVPPLQGDSRLMRVVLQNLMENAWKYSARSAAARVEVGSVCNIDGGTTYYVRDNGVGFCAKEAARAFLPFKRLSTSAGFPGTGLGLSTVKRIIEHHNGRVWSESVCGEGATFYFKVA